MAGFFKRAMVYLGLVDDEYEDYEEYEPRVSVGPRLAQRDARLEASEDSNQHLALVRLVIRPEQGPRLGLGRIEAECLGHHAEHRAWPLIEAEALADEGTVSAQCRCPKFVGDHDGTSMPFVASAESSAQGRGNTEGLEE